ncbi:MAG: serine hydrolase [Chitinophagaceae bacterium]|nr:serine hydrolase [Chitinophagaceae bacterium]
MRGLPIQRIGFLLKMGSGCPGRTLHRGLGLGVLLVISLSAPAVAVQPASRITTGETRAVAAAVHRLPAVVREVMRRTGVPGVAVAVVHRDRLLYAEGFGVRDVEQGGAVNADTVFQLASISKPLGATAVAALISRGVISWDTPAAKLLPGFALADPWVSRQVTIGDLYAHRSGLPGDFGNDLDALGFDRQTILERARLVPLAPFRLTYSYSNVGITAGATAAARAAGMDWATLTRDLLFKPLGMERTTFSEGEFRRMDNIAVLHQKLKGRWIRGPLRHTDRLAPAGGASASVSDMARWLRLMLNDGRVDGTTVVAEGPLQRMRSLQIRNGGDPKSAIEGYGYGLQVSVSNDSPLAWFHAGDFLEGASTQFYLFPDLQLGIIVLTNGWPAGVPQAVIATFDDLVRLGSSSRDWLRLATEQTAPLTTATFTIDGRSRPPKPAPARPLATYVGTYSNPYGGSATVSATDGQLILALGPSGATRLALRHWSGDVFFFNDPAAPEGFYRAVTFSGNRAGLSSTMTLAWFTTGLGTMARQWP